MISFFNTKRVQMSPEMGCNETLKEQAARLLFMAISWPKTVHQFVCLPQNEQVNRFLHYKCNQFIKPKNRSSKTF